MFARRGCQKLVLVDLDQARLSETENLVASVRKEAECLCLVADISDVKDVQSMIKESVDRFSRIDFAINNAGFATGGQKTADTTLETFEKNCMVNEKGVSRLIFSRFDMLG